MEIHEKLQENVKIKNLKFPIMPTSKNLKSDTFKSAIQLYCLISLDNKTPFPQEVAMKSAPDSYLVYFVYIVELLPNIMKFSWQKKQKQISKFFRSKNFLMYVCFAVP